MLDLARGPNEHLIGQSGSRHELGTPALVLDLDILDANIASLAAHAAAHGYAVRAVAKIHKTVEIAKRQIGAGGNGVCCATLREAEVMADAGIPGVMLFTSVVTPPKLQRLADLHARYDGLLVCVDHEANVEQLEAAVRGASKPLQLLVDFEVGGGRTGLADEDAAVALARRIASSDAVAYAGVQGYVGNHQNTVDYDQRRRMSRELLAPLVNLVERLHREDLAPKVVSGAGTGTHDFDYELGILTEVQGGTYALMDVNYRDAVLRRDEPHPFGPALSVRGTVVSASQPGFVVVDAGIKELDCIFGIENPGILRGAPAGSVYSMVGDDMGRIDLPEGERLAVGDVVELQPPHCYQTLNMYGVIHVVRGDDLVDIWTVDAREQW
jgi:D-serine deaminase-like pyridoxal phosphate-dependent protein